MMTFRLLFISFLSLTLFSCEKGGEPLTAEDFENEDLLNYGNLFEVYSENTPIFTDQASASLVSGKINISATKKGRSVSIQLNGKAVGVYSGEQDPSNLISYRNKVGEDYFSSKSGEKNDAEIRITKLDEVNKLISGTFKATVYHNASSKKVKLSLGEFKDVPIEIPSFGSMTASIGNDKFESNACSYSSTNVGGVAYETITALNDQGTQSISIIINESIQVQSYNLTNSKVSFIYVSDISSTNVLETRYTENIGTVEIQSIDQTEGVLRGIFDVSLVNASGQMIELKMGEFEAIF